MLIGKITKVEAEGLTKNVHVEWSARRDDAVDNSGDVRILLDVIAVPPLASDIDIKARIESRRREILRDTPVIWPETNMNSKLLDQEV